MDNDTSVRFEEETNLPHQKNEGKEKNMFCQKKTLKSILIAVLAVLCIIGGIFIHRFHSSAAIQYNTFSRTIRKDPLQPIQVKPKSNKPDLLMNAHEPSAPKDFKKQSEKGQPTLLITPKASDTSSIHPKDINKESIIASEQEKETLSSISKQNPTSAQQPVDKISSEQGTETQKALNDFPLLNNPQSVTDKSSVASNETVSQQNPLNPDLSDSTLETIPQTEGTQTSSAPTISLRDVLLLRDRFLNGEPCFEEYEKINALENKNQKIQDVLNTLAPYCLSHLKAVPELEKTFRQDKKQAVITYYHVTEPRFIAYLKAIPTYLIDIREINPKGNTPIETLDKIHNEIEKQNIEKALALTDTLPDYMKSALSSFHREAQIYLRAKKSVEKLVLSFEAQGE